MEMKLPSTISIEAVQRAVAWYQSHTRKKIALLQGEHFDHRLLFEGDPSDQERLLFDQILADFQLRFEIDRESLSLRKEIAYSALKNCYRSAAHQDD